MKGKELKELRASLSQRERIFCEELSHGATNKTAALAAGYSTAVGAATNQALRLLARAHIQKYIGHLRAKLARGTGVTAERILKEMKIIAFQDIGEMVNDNDLNNMSLKSIQELGKRTRAVKKVSITKRHNKDGDVISSKVDMELYSKSDALQMMGKHIGMFTDKVDITTKGDKVNTAPPVEVVINHRPKGEDLEPEAEEPEISDDDFLM